MTNDTRKRPKSLDSFGTEIFDVMITESGESEAEWARDLRVPVTSIRRWRKGGKMSATVLYQLGQIVGDSPESGPFGWPLYTPEEASWIHRANYQAKVARASRERRNESTRRYYQTKYGR